MVIIEKINWLSKKGNEAEVTISDGRFKLICFSQPFNGKLGDEIVHPIFALQVQYLVKSYEETTIVEKLSESFSYRITAEVTDKNQALVKIGIIEIEIDIPFPGDIKEGEFVSFNCMRLDLA